ncbi:hypothetical protein DFP74_1589 [Nocardiopsis sp. Huas11]|uniref:hypothetical protein n=1 Tax=Nocardiopsis sp. Huas11 TaxID=2183912 RepID=UPI000EB4FEA6|nr:hypothetical protein [Nocardiopsis sp. Huas11]RKS05971.1 hypothetical protein DFP74_1589 [Nocardiopsis sp. Huas11]
MRNTRTFTLSLDLPGLDLPGLDLPGLGLPELGRPDPALPTALPRVGAPVVPPVRHERRGRPERPRSAPRPRPMRKPGGVR